MSNWLVIKHASAFGVQPFRFGAVSNWLVIKLIGSTIGTAEGFGAVSNWLVIKPPAPCSMYPYVLEQCRTGW